MASPPLTSEERRQAAALHHKQAVGEPLTEAELSLVNRFYAVMEAEETARLQAGREEQERRIASLGRQVQDMEALLAREAAFVERLRGLLAEAAQEREAILRERQRILAQTQSPAAR